MPPMTMRTTPQVGRPESPFSWGASGEVMLEEEDSTVGSEEDEDGLSGEDSLEAGSGSSLLLEELEVGSSGNS